MTKIFGIGLERTGTSSLAAAMSQLGFRTCHFPRLTEEIQNADFANDITVSCRYQWLDTMFPGSKFIYTYRDPDDWLDSCDRWYGHLASRAVYDFTGMDAARQIYGVDPFDRDAWLQGRWQHEDEMYEYFAKRPNDLLCMNICAGDGWSKLRPFVQDNRPFPKDNVFPR